MTHIWLLDLEERLRIPTKLSLSLITNLSSPKQLSHLYRHDTILFLLTDILCETFPLLFGTQTSLRGNTHREGKTTKCFLIYTIPRKTTIQPRRCEQAANLSYLKASISVSSWKSFPYTTCQDVATTKAKSHSATHVLRSSETPSICMLPNTYCAHSVHTACKQ
jgi:hypothetical protein